MDDLFFIPVDEWYVDTDKSIEQRNVYNIPDDDQLFKQQYDSIILPANDLRLGTQISMQARRLYQMGWMRKHLIHYLNYFEKFYDINNDLLLIYGRFINKISIGIYSEEYFIDDIQREIIDNEDMVDLIQKMNIDNYNPEIYSKKLLEKENEIILFLKSSMFIKIIIPLISHFCDTNKLYERDATRISESISKIIIDLCSEQLYKSIYGMAENISLRNRLNLKPSDIELAVRDVILNLMPKYIYSRNIIESDYATLTDHIKFRFLYSPGIGIPMYRE